MNVIQWAAKWGIPQQALYELGELNNVYTQSQSEMSEKAVSSRSRLKASQNGIRLFRNNVGATPAKEKVTCSNCHYKFEIQRTPIRYGLCNTSSKLNKKMKSSDLIGITPVIVGYQHIGLKFGVFTAYETKKGNWTFKGNEHERGQQNFLAAVTALGGIAKFINHEDQICIMR